MLEEFDLSNYPSHSPLYSTKSTKVLKFEDELAGKIMTEVVALASEIYSVKTAGLFLKIKFPTIYF